jgi:hypothetical protein
MNFRFHDSSTASGAAPAARIHILALWDAAL